MNRLIVAPLYHFYVNVRDDSFPQVIDLEGGYKIKKLDHNLLTPTLDFFKDSFSEYDKKDLGVCTYAIYYEYDVPEDQTPIPDELLADIHHITQTLRLIKRTRTVPASSCAFTRGTTTDIGLTEEERETHMYIIGRTGSGKTTMMFSMAKHDIEQGRGMAFLDPHGDAADDLLSIIPKSRLNDFVYINPIDLKYPIGINILELTPGLDEDEAELEKEVHPTKKIRPMLNSEAV